MIFQLSGGSLKNTTLAIGGNKIHVTMSHKKFRIIW